VSVCERQKKQLRLPSADFQNIVWYTNAVIKIVYTVQ
jgi:hypothetical protein